MNRPTPAELQEKQSEIDYLRREKTRLENSISEKNRQISQLNGEKNGLTNQTKNLEGELRKKEQVINNLNHYKDQ